MCLQWNEMYLEIPESILLSSQTCSRGRTVSQRENQNEISLVFQKQEVSLSCWLRLVAAGNVFSLEKKFCIRRMWKLFLRKPTFDCQHLKIWDSEVWVLPFMRWCGCWVRIMILLTFFSVYCFNFKAWYSEAWIFFFLNGGLFICFV